MCMGMRVLVQVCMGMRVLVQVCMGMRVLVQVCMGKMVLVQSCPTKFHIYLTKFGSTVVPRYFTEGYGRPVMQ